MSTDWLTHLNSRGWSVIPDVWTADECRTLVEEVERVWVRYGSPVPYTSEQRLLGDSVSISSAGFVAQGLLSHAPNVAPLLDREPLLEVIDQVLGESAVLEDVSGNLNDETRPFCFWHHHVGGVHAAHFRAQNVPQRPQLDRLVAVIYLSPLDQANGRMLALPRQVDAPLSTPAGVTGDRSWPGQDSIECRPGSLLLLDERTWHAVSRQQRSGRRHYVGLYLVRPAQPTTCFEIASHQVGFTPSSRFTALLQGMRGAPPPEYSLPEGNEPSPSPIRDATQQLRWRSQTVQQLQRALRTPFKRTWASNSALFFELESAGVAVSIELTELRGDSKSYRSAADIGVSYRGPTTPEARAVAETTAEALLALGADFSALLGD